jgi:hypothetical protein
MHSPPENLPVERFENWLKTGKIDPPAGLLARVRSRIDAGEDGLDPLIDGLLASDPQLSDPDMAKKLRLRIAATEANEPITPVWFAWLAPLAAAATLAFAFFSFQDTAPRPAQQGSGIVAPGYGPGFALDQDPELTRIMALASNLTANADMSKLESFENLAFLFD